eukprot:gene10752-biopygen9367
MVLQPGTVDEVSAIMKYCSDSNIAVTPRGAGTGLSDYVLNLEIVLPTGEVIWTGANVLKNATGYNLTQLLVGSEGTLAIITKIVLKLIPAVTNDLLILVPFRSAVQACEAVNAIFLAGYTPSALEFMEREAIEWSMKYVETSAVDLPADIAAHLLIEVDGNNIEELYKDIEAITEIVQRYDVGEILFADSHEQKQMLWTLRRKVGEALSGVRILVDPVFSGNASPVSFTTKSFAGADAYGVADMPQIDYLFLSHDHYDHLDYKTVKALKPKVKRVITGLGVGSHLEHWGYNPAIITERDWDATVDIEPGFTVTYAPARHFSGRGLKRNGTLWTSFVLQTPLRKIYLGGDSGYDSHFARIGSQHGPFDLAILEDGQYN